MSSRAAEDAHGLPRLTRRELLVVAAAAAVAGCAPSGLQNLAPTPTAAPFKLARPATVFADGTVPHAVSNAVARRLSGQAGLSSVTAVAALDPTPDLVLTYGKLPRGYSGAAVGQSPATAITHLRVPVDNVRDDQLRALLSGKVKDWQEVGAPYSLAVRLYALGGLSLPQGVQVSGGAKQVTKADDLLGQVRKQAGSLALVPVELPDWTVRNLGVESVYPVQGRGDAAKSSLAPLALQLGASEALVAQGLDVKALAAVLAGLLVGATSVLDVIAVGDVMLGRGVNNKMVAHDDYAYPYRRIHDAMKTADLRVANLECTVTDLFPVPTDPFTFTFVSSKKAVDGLVYAGFDMLTVANNHANGPGKTPFMDMLSTLRSKNIAVCGGGKNLAEARKPAVASAKGQRVAMLGYCLVPPQGPFATGSTWGLAPANAAFLPQDIKAARQQADIVIPYFHWGIEYTNTPTIDQQRLAHAAIDAGADMVLGVHPHWVQAIENYKGRLIIYSLGNFVFDQDWSRATMEGMLLHLYWRGNTLVSVRWVATLDVDRCAPRPMSQAEGTGDFARMWAGTDRLASGQYGS
jgi:poly-gamma-glutamate capsule biosynthesis protein CapA/YwtB (metallophosphatase superfamily)